jgi:hypothetical protein
LADTIIDVEAFRGLSCYEALEKMLYPNYQITYASNRYTVRRIDQSQTYQGISYNYKGEYIATAVINPLTSLTCATEAQASRVVWVDGSQQLEIIPALKRVDFNQVYGLKESIISRWNFEPCDFQSNGVPKAWWSQNIKRKDFSDRTCAEMLAGSTAILETQATPAYVANDEIFVLEIGQKWGTMGVPRKEFGMATYFGPRGRANERELTVVTPSAFTSTVPPHKFQLVPSQLGATPANGDYIVFPGDRIFNETPALANDSDKAVPDGFEAGVYYRIVDLTSGDDRVSFQLSEANNPTQIIPVQSEDKRKYFYFRFNPMYLRTELQTDNGLKAMNQRGDFLEGMHTPMELPINQKRDGQFFSLAYESNPESENQAGNGFIYVVIEKPKPVYQSGESPSTVHGTYFIDYVKLYFKDQPEGREFTLNLSNRHNQVKEVELWFSEILKDIDTRTVDVNSILKFFNTLIYRDGSAYGSVAGDWQIRKDSGVETKAYSMIIREFFANLYGKPRYLLRGNLDSRIYLFGKTLTETNTGKAYQLNSAVWDVHFANWEVELHEIGIADPLKAKAYSDGYDEGYD